MSPDDEMLAREMELMVREYPYDDQPPTDGGPDDEDDDDDGGGDDYYPRIICPCGFLVEGDNEELNAAVFTTHARMVCPHRFPPHPPVRPRGDWRFVENAAAVLGMVTGLVLLVLWLTGGIS